MGSMGWGAEHLPWNPARILTSSGGSPLDASVGTARHQGWWGGWMYDAAGPDLESPSLGDEPQMTLDVRTEMQLYSRLAWTATP